MMKNLKKNYQIFMTLFAKDKHTFKAASVVFETIDYNHPYDTFDSIVEHELFQELNDKDEAKTKSFLRCLEYQR